MVTRRPDGYHTILRGLQQTTTLTKVQERLGVRRTSLGTLREAAYVFDAALLHEILTTLGPPLRRHMAGHRGPRSKRRQAAYQAAYRAIAFKKKILRNARLKQPVLIRPAGRRAQEFLPVYWQT